MISILIPIYDTPIEYLNQCFDSIDNQKFKNFEVIIVNDGSNEKISTFLSSIKKSNYFIFHQEKGGISKALNYGLERCRYDLVARMDGDDIMLPERLEKQYNHIMLNDIDVLGTQMELFGSKNELTKHPINISKDIILKSDWFINHPTVIFKKNVIINIGGYNSDFDGLEDLELWCRLLVNGYKIGNLPDILLRHRRHDDNATVKYNIRNVVEKINYVKKFYKSFI